jgi:hypothetical protein
MIKMVLAAILLAGGYLLTPARCPAQSKTEINSDCFSIRPNYAQVRYQAVYPGVDLLYYGNRRRLEFDFLVAPKADPKCIRLSFPGARKIRIDRENGDLKLDGLGGEVRFQKPVAYQVGNGKTLVEARYVLKQGGQVGIAVGNYDLAKPLIIDPVFIFSTFLGGGSGFDLGSSIAVDAAGNAYVTGTTESPIFFPHFTSVTCSK